MFNLFYEVCDSVKNAVSNEERLHLNAKYTKYKPVSNIKDFWKWFNNLSKQEVLAMADDLPISCGVAPIDDYKLYAGNNSYVVVHNPIKK